MQQSRNTSIVYQVAILMENDTQGILFNVKRDDFEFPYHTKIFLSTFIVVILISQYVFQRRLFMFLRRPKRRFIGGFQLEFVSISRIINHMTRYKFECSHWLKLQHSDWRANLVKDFFKNMNFPPMRALEL